MTEIVFKINGKQHKISGEHGPDVTLNEYIRTVADLRGTKYMCQEGGCGACVVAVRAPRPGSGELDTFAVNSCLVSALSCHGWEVVTVEGIGSRVAGYHQVQTRLARFNGTQCGYCTPGWVMSMYSLQESKRNLTTKDIENSFAGNICRCTGYRPIADAFKSFATDADPSLVSKLLDLEDLDMFKPCSVKCSQKCAHKKENNILIGQFDFKCPEDKEEERDEDWCVIEKGDTKMIVVDCGSHKWYKAFSLKDIFQVIGQTNDYKLIAGNTGQGVYHISGYPQHVIDVFNVSELKGYTHDVNLRLGAGMSLSETMELFLDLSSRNENFVYLKQFYDHMDLVAHIPVRNIGTIGGNLCLKHQNNEFQSDLFLLFETVGGLVTVAEGESKEVQLSMLDFLKTDLKGKVLMNIILPPLSKCCKIKTYKIMPRSQNAHAVVNAGFLFTMRENTNIVEKASLVFGSISPKFNHATHTEQLLVGKDLFTNETLQAALTSLRDEITPERADPEPSVTYRKKLALALFYKAILSLSPDDRIDSKYRSGAEALKRATSQGSQVYDTDKSVWPLNKPIPKLEALAQCSGEAIFANDLPTQKGEVHGAFVTADVPPGSIIENLDATEALKVPGVVAFFTAKDIPGENTFTPKTAPLPFVQEEILCTKEVLFHGQIVGIIVAEREKVAQQAAKLVKIKYKSISRDNPLLTIEQVLNSPSKSTRVTTNTTVKPSDRGTDVKTIVYGDYRIESQYHYTMELQTCVTRPTEGGLEVYASTQWLDFTQMAIAQTLNLPQHSVQVIVRRLGGAYGGKISRATQVACASALVTQLTGRPCRFVTPLQTNMRSVGKRCANSCNFEIGVNHDGDIQYLTQKFYQDNGCSVNETISPLTAIHFVNCYDARRWYIEANSVITDQPSTTWCRAPASTEGIAMIEHIMEKIAYHTGKDPMEIRLRNMKPDHPVIEMIQQLQRDCDYDNRMAEIHSFNQNNRWRKRALKIIPMQYDLHYFGNYSSVVCIYHGDGSVVITHGGIEMGQGINTKVAQVCAYILGIPLEKVSVKPSNTHITPNAMVTGGSIGSECLSYATMKACNILLERLRPTKEKMGNKPWEELVAAAYAAGVDLQSSYMFTQKDDVQNYEIYGVVALEVELDVLTGNHNVARVDLVEDTGRSLNPEIDVGQIEGAFVMGLGYWTSEKLVYDVHTGELLTDRTWTYKPPGIKDIPADMRIYFRRNANNPVGVLQSKATGEPAFCLAVVVTHALREAVRAARLDASMPDQWIEITNPCTVENIFTAVDHHIEHYKLK